MSEAGSSKIEKYYVKALCVPTSSAISSLTQGFGCLCSRVALEWDSCVTLGQTFMKMSKVVAKSCKKPCGVPVHWDSSLGAAFNHRPLPLPELHPCMLNILLILTLLC